MSDLDGRFLGGLELTVINCRNLFNVVSSGTMDVYVAFGLNQDKQRTREIADGGCNPDFGETIHFNLDCMPFDVMQIKVKHKSSFSQKTIGVFSLKMGDLIKHQKRKLKFQLVDEESFEPRGTIELSPEYHGTNEPPMPAAKATPVPTPGATPAVDTRSLEPQSPPVMLSPSGALVAPIPVAADSPSNGFPSATINPPVTSQVFAPSQVIPAGAMSAPMMQQQQQQGPPPLIIAPPVAGGGYNPPPAQLAPPVVQPYGSGGFAPQQPVMQQQPYQPQQYGSGQPIVQQQQPYGSGQPIVQQQQPYGSGQPIVQQPYGSQQPIMQQQQPYGQQPMMQQQQPYGSQQPVMQQQRPVMQQPVMQQGPAYGSGQPQVQYQPAAYGSGQPQVQYQPAAYGSAQPQVQYQSAAYGVGAATMNFAKSIQQGFAPFGMPQQQQPQQQQRFAPPPMAQPVTLSPPAYHALQPSAPSAPYSPPAQNQYGSGGAQPAFAAAAPQQQQQQQQVAVAPFQTLSVGRPHQDSRMFDDVQYLGMKTSASLISEVRIFADNDINGIQLIYNIGGQRLEGPIAGTTQGGAKVMNVDETHGERIEQITGLVSAASLQSLTIKTNRQSCRFGASTQGQAFQLNIPQGHRVVGFHGSFAQVGITSIGAYTTL